MKPATLPTWRDNSEIAALYKTIQVGAEALPRLRDERDTAKRKHEAARETLAQVDLRHRARRVSDADLKRAQARADEAHDRFAKSDADLEDAIRTVNAAEAVLPEVIAEARKGIGEKLMEIYRAKIAAFAPALIALAAQADELQQLAAHIEVDYAGPATHAGHSRLNDFPGDAIVLAPANSTRRVINRRHVENWLDLTREQGFRV
jgi:hypothetical protein